MNDLVAILASVTVVSLISFVGVIFIGLKESLLRRIVMALVGFASGTLLGGAFFDLLPEAVNMINPPITIFYFVTLGIIVFFCIEKFLYWRHCHEEECQVHTFAYISLVGDGVHNFIDGMIIAATFVLGFELGFITTLAVISHEIPQEIGDFGVLIYSGLGKRKALTYNFISALTAILGAIVTYYVVYLRSNYALLVPFAAGGFIYIAATDLMPELHKKSHAGESIIQLLSILFGLGLMAYLTSLINA
ncbi:MAG: ZIP family metal transporter [Candidatus Bathyarchaeota archaeon]|nr:ZIP family metal transporter [Candidatus Bathyarchaeota archaeon]